MAAFEWAMQQPTGGIPYSPEDVAIAEAQAAKQTVPYENTGQTPPTQENTKSVLPKALQVWAGILVVLAIAWLFFNQAMKDEGVHYDGVGGQDHHVVAASVEAAVG